MLNFLSNSRDQKLINAIQQGDLDRIAKLLHKYSAESLMSPLLNQQSASEIAIRAHQPKALELLLNKHSNANAPASTDEPLLLLALQQESQSLGLLTQLLRAGGDANTSGLLLSCFEHCSGDELMVHLSRLIEHGASLIQNASLMIKALHTERLDLIHFLINSGAELPENLSGISCTSETLQYAKRCIDDRKIREMMQKL